MTTSFQRWRGDFLSPFIYEAARALQRRGLEVQVIATHCPGAKARENWGGIEILRPRYLWPDSLEVLQSEPGGLPLAWKNRPAARIAFVPLVLSQAIAAMRHSHASDLIHANWTLSAAAAWLGRPIHRRRIVVTVHGSDIYQAAKLPLVRDVTRIALGSAHRVLAPSASLREATVKLGVPAEHVAVLPDGVDTGRFRPSRGGRQPIILFVGWLIERKGVRHLIEAMAQVAHTHESYRLVVIGEGPERQTLSDRASRLGIETKVDFLGTQTPDQVGEWMRRAKLFVLPSLEEGLGVVLLEALASGTPCVASRVGGIPDIITRDVGLLVEGGSSASLARAIEELLDDDASWSQMSQNARTLAEERYSWDVIARQLHEVYQAVLENRAG